MAEENAGYSDIVEITRKVQDQVDKLPKHFKIDSLTKDGYANIPCTTDKGLEILGNVREGFKEDFVMTEKITHVAIIPRPKRSYSLSSVRLLGFQGGPSKLEEFGGPGDCVVLIPVLIVGNGEATVKEPETGRQTDITFKAKSAIIIKKGCEIWIRENKIVCVMLCIGTDKE